MGRQSSPEEAGLSYWNKPRWGEGMSLRAGPLLCLNLLQQSGSLSFCLLDSPSRSLPSLLGSEYGHSFLS